MSLTSLWPAAVRGADPRSARRTADQRPADRDPADRDPADRVHVAVTDVALTWAARRVVAAVLRDAARRVDLDRARSTGWRLARGGGSAVVVGPTDARLVAVALEAARLTGGLVDPTVGTAVLRHAAHHDAVGAAARAARGGLLPVCGSSVAPRSRPAVGAEAVRVAGPAVSVPAGTVLDLSATTDAVAAHAAARAVADRLRTGALVDVGGDVAQAGPAPADGWGLLLPGSAAVRLPAGRSASTVRPGESLVVDPRTGDAVPAAWAAVTVVHPDPLSAKAYALAAAVLGTGAAGWLDARSLTYRLVGHDGAALTSPGWPRDVRPVGAVRPLPVPLPAPRRSAVA